MYLRKKIDLNTHLKNFEVGNNECVMASHEIFIIKMPNYFILISETFLVCLENRQTNKKPHYFGAYP